MQRGVKVEQVREAVSLCKQNGIQTGMFLMWGYEGEEIADIEATVDHVKQCRPDVFFTTVSYPIKGTPYFDKVASRLVSIRPVGKQHGPRDSGSRPAFGKLLSPRRRTFEERDGRRSRTPAKFWLRVRRCAPLHEVEA